MKTDPPLGDEISIHSPLTRGDPAPQPEDLPGWNFNPLPSHEGRPKDARVNHPKSIISIHSPLTRGDPDARRTAFSDVHFNPLPSHEGRPGLCSVGGTQIFISIHSPLTRGDHQRLRAAVLLDIISIHSPLTRGDPDGGHEYLGQSHFNPLPSHEGRLICVLVILLLISFQSTPLSRGETVAVSAVSMLITISIHSPLTRGDP